MKITQIDNRRLRRARWLLQPLVQLVQGPHADNIHYAASSACAHFNYLLDSQSARIARRCSLTSFAGVPAAKEPPKLKDIPSHVIQWAQRSTYNCYGYRCYAPPLAWTRYYIKRNLGFSPPIPDHPHPF